MNNKKDPPSEPALYLGVNGNYLPVRHAESLNTAGGTLLLWLNITLRNEALKQMERAISEQIRMPVMILDARFAHVASLEYGDEVRT